MTDAVMIYLFGYLAIGVFTALFMYYKGVHKDLKKFAATQKDSGGVTQDLRKFIAAQRGTDDIDLNEDKILLAVIIAGVLLWPLVIVAYAASFI